MRDIDETIIEGRQDNKYTEPSTFELASKLMSTLPIKDMQLLNAMMKKWV